MLLCHRTETMGILLHEMECQTPKSCDKHVGETEVPDSYIPSLCGTPRFAAGSARVPPPTSLLRRVRCAGGCGQRQAVAHVLEEAPRVFTLQLGWESCQEDSADIASTMQALAGEVSGAALQLG